MILGEMPPQNTILANAHFKRGFGGGWFGFRWLDSRLSPYKETLVPLMGLMTLGCLGGLLLEANASLLRIWAKDMAISQKTMDWISVVVGLGYLKFLWAPFLEKPLPLPAVLKFWALAQRRVWVGISLGLSALALISLYAAPFFGLWFFMGLFALSVGRSTFDALAIVSQRDALGPRFWGISEVFCVGGYRLAMGAVHVLALWASGAGASWRGIYMLITLSVVLLGVGLVWPLIRPLIIPLTIPLFKGALSKKSLIQHIPVEIASLSDKKGLWGFLNKPSVSGNVKYALPFRLWLRQKGSWVLLGLMVFYRAPDGVISPLLDLFFLHHNYSRLTIGMFKSVSTWAGVIGGILAGLSIRRWGYKSTLWGGWALYSASLLLFWLGSQWFYSWIPYCYGLERFFSGFAMIALFAFQLVCVQNRFRLAQLALLTSLNHFAFQWASARSGWIVETWGWEWLFGIAVVATCLVPPWIYASFKVPLVRTVENGPGGKGDMQRARKAPAKGQ